MNRDDFLSEERLNAFIDGELDSEEKSRVFAESERDPELEQRLCQQRKLNELVRHAYEEPPRPHRTGNNQPRRGLLSRALAASVFIIVGVTGGMLAHWQLEHRNPAGPLAAASSVSGDFLLHVSSGETSDMQEVLRKAREIIDSSTPDQPHRVEVVANEQGLNLLRSDMTPFAGEIAVLAEHDVVFYACSRAIQRLEDRGVEVQLVPQADSRFTALDRVVLRMQDGWNYVRL